MELSLTTRPGRAGLVVHLAGDLDLGVTPAVRDRLRQALDDDVRNVVLDLAGVPLIDSTALGMIVWLHKHLLERGGRVCIAAAQPVVRSVLDLTSVDRLIGVYDSVASAEAGLAAGGED
ncbi:STAS domain-containing protein [Dactylosporangium sp. CS-047395]|uniref:STAS domain-containing protein n=1 Tax=Dactylosporangium sp. CS-047395 TaxID=3239936 RepID=UPI003D8F188C